MRRHLWALVLAALLPALTAGGIGAWQAVDALGRSYRERLAETAHALALAVDGEIAALEAAAVTMATAPSLANHDLDLFLQRALPVAESIGATITAYGPPPEFRLLRITVEPLLTEADGLLPPYEARAVLQRAAAERRLVLGDVGRSRVTGRPIALLALPVMRDGGVVAVVGVALDLLRLSDSLGRQGMAAGRVAALTDSSHAIAARSRDAAAMIGRPTLEWWPRAAGESARGVLVGHGLRGEEVILGYARLARAPGWTMLVVESWESYAEALRAPLRWLGLGLVMAVLLAAVPALALMRGLLRPMRELAQGAAVMAADAASRPPAPTNIAEFEALRSALLATHEGMRLALSRADRQRAQLQAVLDSLPEAVFVRDQENRYLMVNEPAARLLGRPAAAILGRLPGEVLPPEVAARIAADQSLALAEGRPVLAEYTTSNGILAALPPGGERPADPAARVLLAQIAAWRASDPPAGHGVVTTLTDVTAWREAERRLQGAEQEMQRLARRATLGALASGLAHELNQPLTAATNYLNALQRLLALPEPALAPARDAAQRAAAQTLRAGEIVRGLREFVTHRRLELRPEPVAPLLREALQQALAATETREVTVEAEIPEELGTAMLDRVAIQQVLVNLLRNALEAMAAGPERRLRLAARRAPQGGLEIRVVDSGPGIAPELRDRLFAPFASSKPEGMGIGLFISRALAEAHGAEIALEEAGPGRTCFLLRLNSD